MKKMPNVSTLFKKSRCLHVVYILDPKADLSKSDQNYGSTSVHPEVEIIRTTTTQSTIADTYFSDAITIPPSTNDVSK